MKRFFNWMLSVSLLVVMSVNVQAQNRERQRLTREELAKVQAKHIAVDLDLGDAVSKRFVETYLKCQQEVWALRLQSGKDRKKPTVAASEEEIKQELQRRFSHARKLLDIREKYYNEYSQFLTQKQIKQLYQQEKKMMNRLAARKKNNKQR